MPNFSPPEPEQAVSPLPDQVSSALPRLENDRPRASRYADVLALSRSRRTVLLLLAIAALFTLAWRLHQPAARSTDARVPVAPKPAAGPADPAGPTPVGITTLYAHNLLLHRGPLFRVYVRWIRGEMLPTNPRTVPSFDDPDSFVLQIDKGVVHTNIGDFTRYMNATLPQDAPLKNLSVTSQKGQLTLHGTLHKIIPLHVALTGTLTPTSDGNVRFHTAKLSTLHLPLKGLFGALHLTVADLLPSMHIRGVTVDGNDLVFDTQTLFPAPHIRGQLTALRVTPVDVEATYGNARDDEQTLAQWHNFLRLEGGTVDFAKLTMRPADITMIDATHGTWFDLDLVHYQAQLVAGTIHINPSAGLEIYMPDLNAQARAKEDKAISLDWLRNRSSTLPADVPSH